MTGCKGGGGPGILAKKKKTTRGGRTGEKKILKTLKIKR